MKFSNSLVELLKSGTNIKVLRYFVKHDAPMSEREIASLVNVSHTHLNRTLKELAKYNLVTFVTTGKAHLWKINKKSYSSKAISGIINSIALLEAPLDDLKKNIKKALPERLIKKAVLFGSVARGQERVDSDIDLFLLVKDDKDKNSLIKYVDNLSNLCLDLYGNRLSAYILTEGELKQKKNSNIIEEAEKGIQII